MDKLTIFAAMACLLFVVACAPAETPSYVQQTTAPITTEEQVATTAQGIIEFNEKGIVPEVLRVSGSSARIEFFNNIPNEDDSDESPIKAQVYIPSQNIQETVYPESYTFVNLPQGTHEFRVVYISLDEHIIGEFPGQIIVG